VSDVYCRKEFSLTEEEKEVFVDDLQRREVSDNIWDLFGEWVAKSTDEVRFFFLKVYREEVLVGLGLFLKIKPVDLRTSYSKLRKNRFLNRFSSLLSLLSNNCLYICFRNLVTANLTRPFFFRTPEMEETTMRAILTYLKLEEEADMVTILDTSVNDVHYQKAGFSGYPASSESWLDASRYGDVSEYLDEHRNLKKNLKKRKNIAITEIQRGPISDTDKNQIKGCLDCSVRESRVNTPAQRFFEENIFETEVFNSNRYVHILIRIDERIVGFHVFQVSGSSMGGVLGGFDRDHSRKNFVYERVIIASLDYAIKNGLSRVNYSLIDNFTKLRLMSSLEPCGLYFYSRNPINRKVFGYTFRFSDMYRLHLLEKRGLAKN
jgi:hypothetical protein